jgi:DNA-directed RNA polymerase subunit RPC12/RpoP
MPVEIKYMCHNCGRYISWIYNQNEDEINSDTVTGCPGKECTEVHDISVRKVEKNES